LLEKYPDKINWLVLSGNTSEYAIKLLEKYPDKINWYHLYENSSKGAIQLVEKYPIKKNPNKKKYKNTYKYLYQNPHIFNYDYKKMKQNCMLFKEDLIKNRFHPCNIPKFKDWRVNGFE